MKKTGGGPEDFNYVTPEEAYGLKLLPGVSIDELREMANSDEKCFVCGAPAWKFAEMGLCFTCTTGESDASGDYELTSDEQ